MKPFPVGILTESQGRLRQEFVDFRKQWQVTKQVWRDRPADQFEQECLSPLEPSLRRVDSAIEAFTEAIRKANQLLADPDAG